MQVDEESQVTDCNQGGESVQPAPTLRVNVEPCSTELAASVEDSHRCGSAVADATRFFLLGILVREPHHAITALSGSDSPP